MFIELKDIFIFLIAIYGASLSTYLAWKKIQEYSPQIKIKASEWLKAEMLVSEYGNIPVGNSAVVSVEAKNYGQKTVILTEGGFLLPKNRKLRSFLPTSISFPHELTSEKSVELAMECLSISKALNKEHFSNKVKLIPYFEDAIGRKYTGRPIFFNINLWSKDFLN